MFIVTRLNVYNNIVNVIKVVEFDDYTIDKLIAYDALIKDALENKNEYSIKNISGERVEVYNKTWTGTHLLYVYELHEVSEPEEQIETEVN